MSTAEDLLTTREAAAYLGINIARFQYYMKIWMANGDLKLANPPLLKGIPPPRRFLFRRGDLDKLRLQPEE